MKNLYIGSALVSALIFASCGNTQSKSDSALETSSSYQEKLLTQLIDAKAGDVIEVPEGTYNFDRSLSLTCLLYTSPSPRDATLSRMPSSA